MRLDNKTVLITGGAAGIGKATAARFTEEGANVAICDLNVDAGQTTAEELGIRFDEVNITDRQAVGAWVDSVAAAYGGIDVLVNNAGILHDGALVKVKDDEVVKQMTEPQFDSVIGVNLKGVFNCAQAAAVHMIRQNGGVILNAASIVGVDGNYGQTNYVASKAGVIGMTKVWARELGRYNIRVNAVAPGVTETDLVARMPQQIRDEMISHTPLGCMGQPVDIANAYLFLASDEARFISGITLRVDGGFVVGT